MPDNCVGHGDSGVKGRYMARALIGYIGTGSDQALSLEVVRLRRRIQELEGELADLRARYQPVLDRALDLELHRLSEGSEPAEPALA